MKYNYIDKLDTVRKSTFNKLETIRNNSAEIDKYKKSGDISPNEYEARKKEYFNDRKEVLFSAQREIEKIMLDFFDFVDEWNVIKGIAITDDAKLLDPNMGIKDNQLKAMLEKYRYNPTMTQMIVTYCKNHDVYYTSYAYTADDYKQEFENLCNMVINGINGGYEGYSARLVYDEPFKKNVKEFKQFCDFSEMDKYISLK